MQLPQRRRQRVAAQMARQDARGDRFAIQQAHVGRSEHRGLRAQRRRHDAGQVREQVAAIGRREPLVGQKGQQCRDGQHDAARAHARGAARPQLARDVHREDRCQQDQARRQQRHTIDQARRRQTQPNEREPGAKNHGARQRTRVARPADRADRRRAGQHEHGRRDLAGENDERAQQRPIRHAAEQRRHRGRAPLRDLPGPRQLETTRAVGRRHDTCGQRDARQIGHRHRVRPQAFVRLDASQRLHAAPQRQDQHRQQRHDRERQPQRMQQNEARQRHTEQHGREQRPRPGNQPRQHGEQERSGQRRLGTHGRQQPARQRPEQEQANRGDCGGQSAQLPGHQEHRRQQAPRDRKLPDRDGLPQRETNCRTFAPQQGHKPDVGHAAGTRHAVQPGRGRRGPIQATHLQHGGQPQAQTAAQKPPRRSQPARRPGRRPRRIRRLCRGGEVNRGDRIRVHGVGLPIWSCFAGGVRASGLSIGVCSPGARRLPVISTSAHASRQSLSPAEISNRSSPRIRPLGKSTSRSG